jgi:hypothetical protein
MSGRESSRENDLFFVCSVIEYMGRATKNHRRVIVEKLGDAEISRLIGLADVFHCEPIENTANELIEKYNIKTGDFDNVALCKFNIPTHFDIAKVYKRLITAVSAVIGIKPEMVLRQVYSSRIVDKIDDYNNGMYFENPQYIYESYVSGEPVYP